MEILDFKWKFRSLWFAKDNLGPFSHFCDEILSILQRKTLYITNKKTILSPLFLWTKTKAFLRLKKPIDIKSFLNNLNFLGWYQWFTSFKDAPSMSHSKIHMLIRFFQTKPINFHL